MLSVRQWVGRVRAGLGGEPTPTSEGEEEIKPSYSVSGVNSEPRQMSRFSVPSAIGLGSWDWFQVKKRILVSRLQLQWPFPGGEEQGGCHQKCPWKLESSLLYSSSAGALGKGPIPHSKTLGETFCGLPVFPEFCPSQRNHWIQPEQRGHSYYVTCGWDSPALVGL